MTTIKLKNGSGAPLAGDLVQGEPALDLTNKRLYTEDSGGTVIEVGTNPTSLTTGTFTSTGIDDNAASTAITIDGSQNVSIGGRLQIGNNIPVWSGYWGGALFLKGDNSTPDRYAQLAIVNNLGNIVHQGLILNNDGNVGIGTSSPSTKLEISNGAITAGNSGTVLVGRNSSSFPDPGAGYFSLETNNTDGNNGGITIKTLASDTLTERMRIDGSGNVGIGESSPSGLLHLKKASDTADIILESSGGSGKEYLIGSRTDGSLNFYDVTASTERVRINASGNVGIGTANSISCLSIGNSSADGVIDYTKGITFVNTVSSYSNAWVHAAIVTTGSAGFNGSLIFATDGNGALNTDTSGLTERMRIDASGNLLVGATSISSGPGGIMLRPNVSNGSGLIDIDRTSTTATSEAFLVRNGGTVVGKITYNNTSTSYVTSSDYRLKENVVPLTGAIDRVKQLNPSRFNFIVDADTTVDGFLAHEVADVVPEAITGTKDGMRDEEYEVTPAVYEDVVIPAVLDEEGNEVEAERTEQQLVSEAVMGTRSVPDYQGIDQSKLVPLLVATIQELEARITALESN